jgi:hypothetical protein
MKVARLLEAWQLVSAKKSEIGENMLNKLKFTLALFGGPVFVIIDYVINKNLLGHAAVFVLLIIVAMPIWPYFCNAWGMKYSDVDINILINEMTKEDINDVRLLASSGKKMDAIKKIRQSLPGTSFWASSILVSRIRNRPF